MLQNSMVLWARADREFGRSLVPPSREGSWRLEALTAPPDAMPTLSKRSVNKAGGASGRYPPKSGRIMLTLSFGDPDPRETCAAQNFAAQIERRSLFCSSPFGVLMA